MEKLGELQLDIVYVAGRENVAADVLSRYGHQSAVQEEHVARYDTSDVSLHAFLRTWLQVVAPHLQLEDCLLAAR